MPHIYADRRIVRIGGIEQEIAASTRATPSTSLLLGHCTPADKTPLFRKPVSSNDRDAVGLAELLAHTGARTLRVTRAEGKPLAWVQAAVSTAAFAIWVLATGVPFSWLSFYDPVYGGVALILFTLGSGLVASPKADEPTRSGKAANA